MSSSPPLKNETGQPGERLAGFLAGLPGRGEGSGNPAADDDRRHHVEHSRNTEEGDGEGTQEVEGFEFRGFDQTVQCFSLFWVRDPRVSRLSGLAAGRIWGGLGEVDRLGDHADEHVEGGGGAEEGDGEGAELVDGVELRLFDQTVHFLSPFLVFRLRHSVLASPLKT